MTVWNRSGHNPELDLDIRPNAGSRFMPSSTMRIFSSAVNFFRVRRFTPFTNTSASRSGFSCSFISLHFTWLTNAVIAINLNGEKFH